MNTKRCLSALGLLLIPALLGSEIYVNAAEGSPSGEQKMCPCPEELRHVLGGHAFLPSFTIPSPFADSIAQIGLSFGYATYSASLFGVGRDIKLGAFQPSARGQVRLFDKFALGFGIRGNIITGVNSVGALDFGASVAYAFDLSGIYELLRQDRDVISVALNYSHPHSLTVSPLESAREGLQSLRGTGDADFSSSAVTSIWEPGFRYAHTINRSLGLQALAGLRINDTKENQETSSLKTSLSLGVGLSSDLKPWISIPLGVTLNYRRGQILTSEGSNFDIAELGVFETFNPSFKVGLEAGVMRVGEVNTTVGTLLVRTYYN
jgi:hypothetical protein